MKVGPSGDTYFLEKVINKKRLSRKSSSIVDNEIVKEINKDIGNISNKNQIISNV